MYEIDLVNAQETGQKFKQTISDADVHFGDIPAESVARVVGHDHMILQERPSEVTLNDPAIQADFRSCVDFNLQSPHKDEQTNNYFSIKKVDGCRTRSRIVRSERRRY